jgi:hypothetical protein
MAWLENGLTVNKIKDSKPPSKCSNRRTKAKSVDHSAVQSVVKLLRTVDWIDLDNQNFNLVIVGLGWAQCWVDSSNAVWGPIVIAWGCRIRLSFLRVSDDTTRVASCTSTYESLSVNLMGSRIDRFVPAAHSSVVSQLPWCNV